MGSSRAFMMLAARHDVGPRSTHVAAVVLCCVALCACGDNLNDPITDFAWREKPAADSAYSVDGVPPDDQEMIDKVDAAIASGEVVLFYGHRPPIGTSYETIEALLARAEMWGATSLSFAELAAGPPRPGICLSFDDTEVDAWTALEPILARHGAHVSFFVTRYAQFTDDQRAKLHALYEEGHSIEAHGVNHAHATEYIPKYGLQAYIDNEVLPSIQILRDDGFAPVAYAHPGGSHTQALDDALIEHIQFVRGISERPR